MAEGKPIDLVVGTDGNVRSVYNEDFDLRSLGTVDIQRASHVEPIEGDEQGRWKADLTPVNGPILQPFDTRSEALEAEAEWLRENWIPNG